jgi:hypothetical protein
MEFLQFIAGCLALARHLPSGKEMASACPRDGASNIRSPRFIPAKSSHPSNDAPSLTKAPARWGGQALAGQLRCYSGWGSVNDREPAPRPAGLRPFAAETLHRSVSGTPLTSQDGACNIRSSRFIPATSSHQPNDAPSLTKAPARRTEGAPTYTRHASGVTGRAGAGPSPGSVARSDAREGGSFAAIPARVLCSTVPSHRRCADSCAARLRRDGAPLAPCVPHDAAGSRANRAQAGAGPSPGSVARSDAREGGSFAAIPAGVR